MRNVDVCLSPELLHLYDVRGKIVVVVDILRATSCMTTAIAHGMKAIIPVSTVEECKSYCASGELGAAERNGKQEEGFDFGNSPFSFMTEEIKGETLAMTTTNGTKAINKSREAIQVLIGSFLNISALASYISDQPHDVVILCAGWKGRVNLEDTLFAGALVDKLNGDFLCEHDASLVAHALYKTSRSNLLGALANCSHYRRLSKLNIGKDIEFCMQEDVYEAIPVLEGDQLVKLDVTATNDSLLPKEED